MIGKYKLGLDKTIERVVPVFLRKPRQIQWIKALMYPLKGINESMQVYFKELLREASMSSQTEVFEIYLNDIFSDYIENESDRIKIIHSLPEGVAIWFESENSVIENVIYNVDEGQSDFILRFDGEDNGLIGSYEFAVELPQYFENNLPLIESIKQTINKYKVASFRYSINYTQ